MQPIFKRDMSSDESNVFLSKCEFISSFINSTVKDTLETKLLNTIWKMKLEGFAFDKTRHFSVDT